MTDRGPKITDLEPIARVGGTFNRIAPRIPSYLTDMRENSARLPMFVLARTTPFRKAQRMTARPVSRTPSSSSMFGDIDPRAAADELRPNENYPGFYFPEEIGTASSSSVRLPWAVLRSPISSVGVEDGLKDIEKRLRDILDPAYISNPRRTMKRIETPVNLANTERKVGFQLAFNQDKEIL